jgi:hypothetical protein
LNTAQIGSIVDFYKRQGLLFADSSYPSLDEDRAFGWTRSMGSLDTRNNSSAATAAATAADTVTGSGAHLESERPKMSMAVGDRTESSDASTSHRRAPHCGHGQNIA